MNVGTLRFRTKKEAKEYFAKYLNEHVFVPKSDRDNIKAFISLSPKIKANEFEPGIHCWKTHSVNGKWNRCFCAVFSNGKKECVSHGGIITNWNPLPLIREKLRNYINDEDFIDGIADDFIRTEAPLSLVSFLDDLEKDVSLRRKWRLFYEENAQREKLSPLKETTFEDVSYNRLEDKTHLVCNWKYVLFPDRTVEISVFVDWQWRERRWKLDMTEIDTEERVIELAQKEIPKRFPGIRAINVSYYGTYEDGDLAYWTSDKYYLSELTKRYPDDEILKKIENFISEQS